MGMQFTRAAVCDLLSPLIWVGSALFLWSSLQRRYSVPHPSVPISSLGARNSSYRCVPSSSRLSNLYHLLHDLYYISVLHLSMSHILDWRILFFFFFGGGLSCFCRMFSPISGLYLLNVAVPSTWNRTPPQQMFLKLQRYYQYICRYYFSFMPLNPLAWALPLMTLYAKPSPQHLVTNTLVQRLELLNRATDLTKRWTQTFSEKMTWIHEQPQTCTLSSSSPPLRSSTANLNPLELLLGTFLDEFSIV